MWRLLGIACLACVCSLAFAADTRAVRKAYVDGKGWAHILTADGRDHTIRPEKWQAGGGFQDLDVAPDGKTVGWLVDQMLTPLEGNTNYAYAVALRLDIWRDGHVIRKFSTPVFPIANWIFMKNGAEVAFHVHPAFGMEQYNCFLFDVQTGKKLSSWDIFEKSRVIPDWAKPLLVNDMPSQEDYAYWSESRQDTKASHAQPK